MNPLEDAMRAREGEKSVVVHADAFELIRIDTNVNGSFGYTCNDPAGTTRSAPRNPAVYGEPA